MKQLKLCSYSKSVSF